MICDIIDQGNDLMGKLAALIQSHFDANPSSGICRKVLFASCIRARLSEKNVGASWPPSFHFWSPEQQYSSRQKLYLRTNRMQ